MESGRVDEIIQKIGSTEVLGEAEPDDGYVGILISEVVMLNSTQHNCSRTAFRTQSQEEHQPWCTYA